MQKLLINRGSPGSRIDFSFVQKDISPTSDKMSFGEQLLGASHSIELSIKGYDEIGREVVEGIAWK